MPLAFTAVARCRYPTEDPRMHEFVELLERGEAAADRAPGFIWRFRARDGGRTAALPFGRERLLITISLWRSLDSCLSHVEQVEYLVAMQTRREWFEVPERESVVLWWHHDPEPPGIAEALFRLQCLWDQGATALAFTLQAPLQPGGQPFPPGWRRSLGVRSQSLARQTNGASMAGVL